MRRLTFQVQALQTEVHRMAAASARCPPSCPCPVAAPTPGAPSHASLPAARPSPRSPRAPVTGAPIGAPPTNSSGRLPQLRLLPRTAHQPPFWTASRVCAAVAPHKFSSFVPPVIVTPIAAVVGVSATALTAASHNPRRHARLLPSCPPTPLHFAFVSAAQLVAIPPRTPAAGLVSVQTIAEARAAVLRGNLHPHSPRVGARIAALVQPGCPVGQSNLLCTSPRCPLQDPLSLWGNGQGAARSATPTSLVQSLGFAILAQGHFLLKATIADAWIVSVLCFFCISVRRPISMVRRGMEHRRGAERVVAGDSWAKTTCGPLATRQQSPSGAQFTSQCPKAGVASECRSTRSRTSSQARRGPRNGVNTSDQVAGGNREFGARRSRGEEDVGRSVAEGKISLVPPVEDRIAQCVKFLERAKKRLAVAETELQSTVQKKSQCEQEVAEGEADLARMREEVPVPADPDEDANIEVQRLKARLAQLESIHGRPSRGSVEAAENIRSKVAKRRVGCCAEDVLPSTEQDLGYWLDDKQAELRDALDMGDTGSATTITGLISRGLAKLASFSVPPSAVSNMVP